MSSGVVMRSQSCSVKIDKYASSSRLTLPITSEWLNLAASLAMPLYNKLSAR